MKKKLCLLLATLMLLSSLVIIPTSATEEPAGTEVEHSLCLDVSAGSNYTAELPLGTSINKDSTLTYWMNRTDGTMNTGIGTIWNVGMIFAPCVRFSSGALSKAPFQFAVWANGLAYVYNGTSPVNTEILTSANSWDRYDYQVSFTDKKITLFINYNKIGTYDFFEPTITSYALFKISQVTGGGGAIKYYIDNMKIREGLLKPAMQDAADKMDTSDPKVLYANKFDTLPEGTTITPATAGSMTLGIADYGRKPYIDPLMKPTTSLHFNCAQGGTEVNGENWSGNYWARFDFGKTISEDCTFSTYFRTESTAATWNPGVIVGLSSNGTNNKSATFAEWTARDLWAYNGNGAASVGKTITSGKWNRVDIQVDFAKKEYTLFWNYEEIGTYAFFSPTKGVASTETGFRYLTLQHVSPRTDKGFDYYFDSMVIRKGHVDPAKYDEFDSASIAAADILYKNDFDELPANPYVFDNTNAARTATNYFSISDLGVRPDRGDVFFAGAQTKKGTDAFDVRFALGVSNIANYNKVGFHIIVKDSEGTTVATVREETETVYTSMVASAGSEEVVYTAEDLGSDYLACLVIKEIPDNLGALSFTVTPYAIDMDGAQVDFYAKTVTIDGSAI